VALFAAPKLGDFMTEPLLMLLNIGKKYSSGENSTLEVLKNINLQMNEGQSAAIVGPSGSGKSTLLNIIGSLDVQTSGRVIFDSLDLSSLNEKKQAELRNRKIGFVFQLHHLLPQCTVLENVLVPVLVNDDQENAEARARNLLEEVGLSERLDYRPGQLSGGERQRVAVVRAMINNPKLLLADEPTGSLDHDGADKLTEMLVRMNKKHGLTLIVVTHSLALAERMDMMFELSNGMLTRKK